MKLSERAAYIKGLIDGLEPDPKDKQMKVLKLIAELLGDMADEINELEQCYDDVCDQVDGIGEDLAGVEDAIYDGDDFQRGIDYGRSGSDDDLVYEVTCPTCEKVINLSETSFNAGCIKCPECGELIEFDYAPDELDPEENGESAEE